MDEFACRDCGSPAVVYPRVFEDDEPVVWAGCAAFVSTYREFKERAERVLSGNPKGAPITGC
jgi:hypothetical protein